MIFKELHLEHGLNDKDNLKKFKALRIDPLSLDYSEEHSYWKVLDLISNSGISLERINIIDVNKSYKFNEKIDNRINSFNQLGDTFYDYGEFFFTSSICYNQDGTFNCSENMLSMYILHEFCHYQRAKLLNKFLKPEHKETVMIENMTNFGLLEKSLKMPTAESLMENHIESLLAQREDFLYEFNYNVESETSYFQAFLQRELGIFPYEKTDLENEVTQKQINDYLSIIDPEDDDEELEIMNLGAVVYDELTKIGVTFNMC